MMTTHQRRIKFLEPYTEEQKRYICGGVTKRDVRGFLLVTKEPMKVFHYVEHIPTGTLFQREMNETHWRVLSYPKAEETTRLILEQGEPKELTEEQFWFWNEPTWDQISQLDNFGVSGVRMYGRARRHRDPKSICSGIVWPLITTPEKSYRVSWLIKEIEGIKDHSPEIIRLLSKLTVGSYEG